MTRVQARWGVAEKRPTPNSCEFGYTHRNPKNIEKTRDAAVACNGLLGSLCLGVTACTSECWFVFSGNSN